MQVKQVFCFFWSLLLGQQLNHETCLGIKDPLPVHWSCLGGFNPCSPPVSPSAIGSASLAYRPLQNWLGGWALPVPNPQSDNSMTTVRTTEVVTLLTWRVAMAGEGGKLRSTLNFQVTAPSASHCPAPSNRAIAGNLLCELLSICLCPRPWPRCLPSPVPQEADLLGSKAWPLWSVQQHRQAPFYSGPGWILPIGSPSRSADRRRDRLAISFSTTSPLGFLSLLKTATPASQPFSVGLWASPPLFVPTSG